MIRYTRRDLKRSLLIGLLLSAIAIAPFPTGALEPAAESSAAPGLDASPAPESSAEPSRTADPSSTPAADEPGAAPTSEPFADPTPGPSDEPATPEPATPVPGPGPELEGLPYLVRFAGAGAYDQRAALLSAYGVTEESSVAPLALAAVSIPPLDTGQVLASLRASTLVLSVEPDRQRTIEAVPDDPLYGQQWALPRIGWPQVREGGAPSGASVVAILDTGVDANQSDLAGQIIDGTSFVDGSAPGSDANGHGTWMAGIVAATTDNGAGIAGVGLGSVRVMPVTVIGPDGTGRDGDIINGIVWAVDQGADVILMAFSSRGYSAALQSAVDYAWQHDVVLVAAVGNDASAGATYPAGDAGVMGVSATDVGDQLWPSSNTGPDVFLAAPGADILTTARNGGYETISGTSAAAAYVAGAAALLRADEEGLSNGVIVGRLARAAAAVGSQAETGNGRLDLLRAWSDESNEAVKPAGAHAADGGPYVGPYDEPVDPGQTPVYTAAALLSQEILADNPVSYWRLNETSGTTATDAMGANDGTYVSGYTLNQGGATGDGDLAVLFDGSAGAGGVTVANSASLQITGDQTMEAWLYPTSFVQRRNPISKAYGGEGTITQEISGALNYYYGTGGGNTTPYTNCGSGTALALNVWSHVVVVRSSTTISWYVNGVPTNTCANPYGAVTASTNALAIGSGYTGWKYDGRIDEVAIYNTALSAARVQAHYLAAPGSGPLFSVGFQAEDYVAGTDTGAGFTTVSEGAALAGEAITTNGNNTAAAGPPVEMVRYNVYFPDAGPTNTYHLYVRYRMAIDQYEDDSGWALWPLDADQTVGTNWDIINDLSVHGDTTYRWVDLGATAGINGVASYTNVAAGMHSWWFGGRENGFYADAFVFSTDYNLDTTVPGQAYLDAVVNDRPVAVDDGYSVNEDGTLNVAAAGVLANDTDPESDPLTASLVTTTPNGALTLNANGSFSYTPYLDFYGTDSFTYRANDLGAASVAATVTITVNAVNDVPSFTKGANESANENAGAQTVAGWATAISAGPANEAAQVVDFIVTNDNNGLFSVQPAISATGTLTYTPAANANGSATVSVQIHDNGGTANGGVDTSAIQTFTITVYVSVGFQAEDYVAGTATGAGFTTVNEGTALAGQAITTNGNNTTAAAGPPVRWYATTSTSRTPARPTATTCTCATEWLIDQDDDDSGWALWPLDADQTVGGNWDQINDLTVHGDTTYRWVDLGATAGINGVASYTNVAAGMHSVVVRRPGETGSMPTPSYSARTSTSTPRPRARPLLMAAVNDHPIAVNDSYSVNEDGSLNVAAAGVLSNDTDPESDPLTASLVTTTPNGALTLNADGSFSYTPNAGLLGTDTFTYRANDLMVPSSNATVTITVNAVNDVPSFVKGANQSVNENSGPQTVVGWATSISAGPANESSQVVDFIVTNDNNGLFGVQPAIAANGTLTYTSATNVDGVDDRDGAHP